MLGKVGSMKSNRLAEPLSLAPGAPQGSDFSRPAAPYLQLNLIKAMFGRRGRGST